MAVRQALTMTASCCSLKLPSRVFQDVQASEQGNRYRFPVETGALALFRLP
jgi:hypothetical protein